MKLSVISTAAVVAALALGAPPAYARHSECRAVHSYAADGKPRPNPLHGTVRCGVAPRTAR